MAQALILAGTILSAILVGYSALVSIQYMDPMILIMGVWGLMPVWLVVLVVHVLRHGVPIRILSDERRPEP